MSEWETADDKREKKKEYDRLYSIANKEHIATRRRQYYLKNKERIDAECGEYYQKNKDTIYERQQRYIIDNKHKVDEYHKKYNIINKERRSINTKEYNVKNKEAISINKKQYYLKNKEAISAKRKLFNNLYPERSVEYQIKRKNRTSPDMNSKTVRVFYKMRKRLSKCLGIPFQVDHIVPLSKGGVHHENNLQVIPKVFNLKKNNNMSYICPYPTFKSTML
jgi:hypothetical protein